MITFDVFINGLENATGWCRVASYWCHL